MEKINLNRDWEFAQLPGQKIENADGDGQVYEKVSLPHTGYRDEDPYRGVSVYRKSISISQYTGKTLFLEIEGADHTARVRVNGKEIGFHKGGYSRGRFAIPREDWGGTVLDIEIYVDNSATEEISPLAGDFTVFGGLYRDVSLLVCEETHFDYMYYGTDGVIVRTEVTEEGKGVIRLEPHVAAAAGAAVSVRYRIFDPEGRQAATAEGEKDREEIIEIPEADLWNGKENPALYSVRAELLADGKCMDQMECRTGFRRIGLNSNEGFFLNGNHIRICGVAKHQDFGGKFNAVTRQEIRKDFALIGEIGANAVRLSHYQHPQEAYDCCDEAGYIAWAEIPMLKMTENPALQENALQQLTELILQNIHHPSICFWGIQNEIAMFRDAGFIHERVAELYAQAKRLDPARIVACANLYPLKAKSKLNHLTDMVGYNIYFGWYYGQMEDYSPYLDKLHEDLPQIPLGVSEYGVDTAVWLHSEKPVVRDYSEEFQALFHETVYPILESKPYLWGSFVWNMFDFSSSRRNEGGQRYINAKGLVTYDRKICKDAFYYYKAKWSDRPFLHICQRRFRKRCCGELEIKVYTNQERAALYRCDKEEQLLGEAQNNGNGTIRFCSVPLGEGENSFLVRSRAADGSVLEEAVVFERVKQPEESYRLPGNEAGSTVQNWFLQEEGIDLEQYYSLHDRAEDLLENEQAHAILKEYLPEITSLLEKGVIPLGLAMTSILSRDGDIGKKIDLNKLNLELMKLTKQEFPGRII